MIGVLLELPHDRDAVHAGHHDVEQDEIGPYLPRLGQAGRSVRGCCNGVAVRLEPLAQDGEVLRPVVNDKDQRQVTHVTGSVQAFSEPRRGTAADCSATCREGSVCRRTVSGRWRAEFRCPPAVQRRQVDFAARPASPADLGSQATIPGLRLLADRPAMLTTRPQLNPGRLQGRPTRGSGILSVRYGALGFSDPPTIAGA